MREPQLVRERGSCCPRRCRTSPCSTRRRRRASGWPPRRTGSGRRRWRRGSRGGPGRRSGALRRPPRPLADRAAHEQLLLQPDRHGHAEAAKPGRRVAPGRSRAAARTWSAACRRRRRSRGPPAVSPPRRGSSRSRAPESRDRLLPREPLFLGGGDDLAVDDQAGGAVVVEGGDTEDRGLLHGMTRTETRWPFGSPGSEGWTSGAVADASALSRFRAIVSPIMCHKSSVYWAMTNAPPTATATRPISSAIPNSPERSPVPGRTAPRATSAAAARHCENENHDEESQSNVPQFSENAGPGAVHGSFATEPRRRSCRHRHTLACRRCLRLQGSG